MSTLVIHAPGREAGKRSFEDTLQKGVGDEYAIPSALIAQLNPGSKVVLLSKDKKKRAEGKLVRLEPKSKTGNGIQRYNVHITDLRIVPYRSEALRRTGVAVI